MCCLLQRFIITFSYSLVLQLLRLLLNFLSVGSISWISKHSTEFLSTEWVILCIIIGDVHQFNSHCLIPLDLLWYEHFLLWNLRIWMDLGYFSTSIPSININLLWMTVRYAGMTSNLFIPTPYPTPPRAEEELCAA